MKSLSLFTGAGGLDLGLEAAGFEVAACVEKDRVARETLKRNRPEWPIAYPGDIHWWEPGRLLDAAGLRPGEAALVAAGPPCQPFSKAGYWASGDSRRLSDPRASTLDALMDVVAEVLPEAVLIENVAGIAFRKKSEAIEHVRCRLRDINRQHGTQFSLQVLRFNAADHGVPQLRERVFLLAHRGGRRLDPPPATHSAPQKADEEGREPWLTAWDAIGDLDNGQSDPELAPTGYWAQLLPSIPEGHNYLWHTDRGGGRPLFGWRTRFWSFLLKLAKGRPSWTLQAEPGPATGPFHWKSRHLSPRELSRLQTFPDDFEPVGSLREVQRQIGNATPPLLAEAVGTQIRSQLLRHPITSPKKPVTERAEACPPPEPIGPVPSSYLEREGTHPPHPGPGRGPRAISRPERGTP